MSQNNLKIDVFTRAHLIYQQGLGQFTLYNIKKRKRFQPNLYEYSRRGKMEFLLKAYIFVKFVVGSQRLNENGILMIIVNYWVLCLPYQVGQGSNSSSSLDHA